MGKVDQLIDRFVFAIIDPLLLLLFAVALVVFLWGIVQFLAAAPDSEDKRAEGKQHMLWGIIGMFIMIAASAIIGVLMRTLQVTTTGL